MWQQCWKPETFFLAEILPHNKKVTKLFTNLKLQQFDFEHRFTWKCMQRAHQLSDYLLRTVVFDNSFYLYSSFNNLHSFTTMENNLEHNLKKFRKNSTVILGFIGGLFFALKKGELINKFANFTFFQIAARKLINFCTKFTKTNQIMKQYRNFSWKEFSITFWGFSQTM